MASTGRALLGQPPKFLVCYSDASCLYRAALLVRATRGRSVLDSTCLAVQISCAIAPATFELCAVTEQPAAKSMDTEMQDAPARPSPLMLDAPARPSPLKRPLSSDGVGSLPQKLFAATIDGSPAPSPRRREVSLAGTKRSRSGEDEAQARRRQFAAAPLPAPVAPEPPTRAPTPAPEPTVPATWLDLMRSLQTDGASPYPLPPRARRPPR